MRNYLSAFARHLQLFKAPEFVHKHLVNKHPEKYKAVVDKVSMAPLYQCAHFVDECIERQVSLERIVRNLLAFV